MKPHGDKHFMVDEELISRIVGYAKVGEGDIVLEVGAGYGSLTRAIAERAKKVIAVEKDPDLFMQLESAVGSLKNVKLIHADATKMKLPKVDKIVSNLPYSISRTITLRFLDMDFKLAVLVYQQEFANKLLAGPDDVDYRFISVLVQSAADVRVLEDVPPDAFTPKPNVYSSVVELKRKARFDKKYADFVRDVFNHKNKKLRNILPNAPKNFADLRPTSLSPKEIMDLYDGLK